MKSVLNYLLEDCECQLVEPSAEMKKLAPDLHSKEIRTKDGDYVTLESLVNSEDIPKNIIYRHKLTDIQALQKGSGNAVMIGFSEEEQKWYGWTHRGYGSFGIGWKADKDGLAIYGSTRFPIKKGFECKTLEDCKYAAKAMADALD